MRIYRDNLIDYAATVISAASEGADLPASNVRDPDRNNVYRTGTSAAAEWLKFDLGSAKAVLAVILLDHTLAAGDSAIYLQGNDTDVWTAPTVNSAITFNAGTVIHHLGASATHRYWRVIFTKSAAGETRDIGRVFLGSYDEMTRGPKIPDGLDITPVDLSQTSRALGGKTHSEIRGQYDQIGIDFPPIGDAQMELLKALAASCGTHTPFFVSIDPTNKPYDLLYYVKAKSLKARKVKLWGSAPAWDAALDLNEEI